MRGKTFVVSAPSGAGKHTVLRQALARDSKLRYSVSATTRSPRAGEENGREYFFLDRAEFEKRAASGEFVEWAEVHGNLYGTLRRTIEDILAAGEDVVLEIDVQGMRKLRTAGLAFVSVFIAPPSMEELERRLRDRQTDSEAQIALRLRNARDEIAAKDEYDYCVVNDEIDRAVAEFEHIIRQERSQRNA
ncbi:MAG TPA: guanylate kinase [Candidatus Hydrogenedentes bacterium]|nr:guanylate kinase [Candidatus Hydrogenedentota bacterium]HOS04222.1 guanylate kinase [Candidatus Hydrogenedentota bacterium]